MTDNELLGLADQLLTERSVRLDAVWPHAAAVLTRQALELSLRQYWFVREKGMLSASTASQLSGLRLDLARHEVGDLRIAWNGLSRALHVSGYNHPPSVEELARWATAVRSLATHHKP